MTSITRYLGSRLLIPAASAALALIACGSPTSEPNTDSQTHWLHPCQSDSACAEGLSCVCGVCTIDCSETTSCSTPSPSICIGAQEGASATVCAVGGSVGGLCLPACDEDNACGDGLTCREGSCIPAAVDTNNSANANPNNSTTPECMEGDSQTSTCPCPDGSDGTANSAVCMDGAWVGTPGACICDDNSSSSECTDGESQTGTCPCPDGSDGTANSAICMGGMWVSTPGACICDENNNSSECTDGEDQIDACTCPDGTDSTVTSATCIDGTWVDVDTFAACDCPAGNNSSSECTEGETQTGTCPCPDGGEGMATSAICMDGMWVGTPGACICEPETCIALDNPGSVTCPPNSVQRLFPKDEQGQDLDCPLLKCVEIGDFACGNGGLMCDRSTQYCQAFSGGPAPPPNQDTGPTYSCTDLPMDCSGLDASCECLTGGAQNFPGDCQLSADGDFNVQIFAP